MGGAIIALGGRWISVMEFGALDGILSGVWAVDFRDGKRERVRVFFLFLFCLSGM